MFLRAKVLEIRDNFKLSSISSIIVMTNDIEGFRKWLNKQCMFMSIRDKAMMAQPKAGLNYYVKIYYNVHEKPIIDRIIKKWKIYESNPIPFSYKVKDRLTFHFGTFITF